MSDSKNATTSKGSLPVHGSLPGPMDSLDSREQPERPPSRSFFARIRSGSSLSNDSSNEDLPQLDSSQPQRPLSRSRNLFSRSRSNSKLSRSESIEELPLFTPSISRPSSSLSFGRPKSRNSTSPTGSQKSTISVFSRWLRKDTPILTEIPTEFVFIEDEALVALTPFERRAIRKAPDYVKTIVPTYQEPENTRRNSIDFKYHGDLFTQDDEIDANVLIPQLETHTRQSNDPSRCKYPNLLKVRFPTTGFAIAPGSFEHPQFNVACNRSDYYNMPLIEEEYCYGSNIARKSPASNYIMPPTATELDRQSLAWAFKNGPDNEDDQFQPNKTYPPRKQAAIQSIILKLMYGMPNVDDSLQSYNIICIIEKLSDDFLEDGTGRTFTISKKIDTYQGKRVVKLSHDEPTNPAHYQETSAQLADTEFNQIRYLDQSTWNLVQEYIVRDVVCNLIQLRIPQHTQLTAGALSVVLRLVEGPSRTWNKPNVTGKHGKLLTEVQRRIKCDMFQSRLYGMIEATVENYFCWRLKRTEFKPSAELPMLRPGEW